MPTDKQRLRPVHGSRQKKRNAPMGRLKWMVPRVDLRLTNHRALFAGAAPERRAAFSSVSQDSPKSPGSTEGNPFASASSLAASRHLHRKEAWKNLGTQSWITPSTLPERPLTPPGLALCRQQTQQQQRLLCQNLHRNDADCTMKAPIRRRLLPPACQTKASRYAAGHQTADQGARVEIEGP